MKTKMLSLLVVVVLPLTPATRGLIGERELAAMRRSAWLVNIGRGPVVDEPSLVRALTERRLAGAVLDVFATEPLPPAHPLWALDNVVITPIGKPPNMDEQLFCIRDGILVIPKDTVIPAGTWI